MKIGECQVILHAALEKTRVAALPETVLGRTGQAEIGMARAYLSDGITFSETGDPVNALASFYYAFGWLHCGNASGTLITDMKTPPCPFISPCERLGAAYAGKLSEKTGRYNRLLDTARSSVIAAPDHSTPAHLFATRILHVAGTYSGCGRWLIREGRHEDALASFSYGHGWLDAGVREGLFTITAERDIFTV
jgi:hypothetical protein